MESCGRVLKHGRVLIHESDLSAVLVRQKSLSGNPCIYSVDIFFSPDVHIVHSIALLLLNRVNACIPTPARN